MKISILLNENLVITSYGICLNENHMPLENGTIIETNLDLDNVELINNYKLVNGQLIELIGNEKLTLVTTTISKPTTDERLASIESALTSLMGV